MPSLNFKGKAVIETHHHTVPHHRLEFDAKLSELPKGEKPSLDGNLIIEGDNLLALKALLPTHAGQVKCIYIDPPYNTGNEGWVYNDNLTQPQFKDWIGQTVGKEGEDSTRHDKWCCMMYPRLALLRELLRDDGAIFVSIDDNEVHHLRCLMDSIFGVENFIATIIWQKVDSPKNTAIHLSEDHDYILLYAKRAEVWRPNALPRTEAMIARYQNHDNDPRGPWLLSDLAARNFYAQGRYPITTPSGEIIEGPPAGSYWRVRREKFDELDKDNRIWWGKSGSNRPGIKRFLSEVKEGVVPQTLWLWKEVGSTRHSKQDLSEVMGSGAGDDVFITPKPVRLIQRILRIATDPDDIVLDSFAGSGTTGHAVMETNEEDAGTRNFILVQQAYDNKANENEDFNICEKISAERVRRVIKGYTAKKNGDKAEKVPGLGGSFSYARVGEPLFGEYRDFGKHPPDFETLAKYIFYTETSRQIDLKKVKPKSGFIGQTEAAGGTSYYLFYLPGGGEKGNEFSLDTLKRILKGDKNRNWVVYCEKFWMHEDELSAFETEHNRRIRAMLIPFQLQ